MNSLLRRREFLARMAKFAAATGLLAMKVRATPGGQSLTDSHGPVTARQFLESILYTKDEVRQWLEGKAFPFARYSAEFGWLLNNGRVADGVDNAISVYTYGKLDERITLNYRDRPCRINTYGNSFTQCHQVSDGETWQEQLAAHLQEPVRNFGVGGWSVHQAYLRMLREEARVPASLIILNIHEDDHFRNLDSWRNIRAPKHEQFIEPTLPYIEVNEANGIFLERPNPCPTEESVYQLCDLDWVFGRFGNDFCLQIVLAHLNSKSANPEAAYEAVTKLTTTHGITTRIDTAQGMSETAAQLHEKAAYFSTQRIVEKFEAYAKAQGKRILYILSYPAMTSARYFQERQRRDQPFLDFLNRRGLPYVDLLELQAVDYSFYKGSIENYLKRYYVGHYTPLGNHFTAFSIKDKVVEMLDPKPAAYRLTPDIFVKKKKNK